MAWHGIVTLSGFGVWLFLAWLLSENRRRFPWKIVILGLLTQGMLAVLLLKVPFIRQVIEILNQGLQSLLGWGRQGALFILGPQWAENPSFLVNVIPSIILVSVLVGLFYRIRVLPAIISGLSYVFMRLFRVTGLEAISSISNIFLGQTEAGLLIQPYLKILTPQEVLTLMTAGMATIAGGVYVVYLSFGVDGAHLLTASVISAPATLIMSRIMRPEAQSSKWAYRLPPLGPLFSGNLLEVVVSSAQMGAWLALNVALMLLVFTALLHGLNQISGFVTQWLLGQEYSFSQLVGFLHAPLTFFWSLPDTDFALASQLLGQRIVFNEFLSYQQLSAMASSLRPETRVVLTYALCGFANFVSMGIQVGGLSALCPERKPDFVAASFRAMVGGLLASYMTASWARLLGLLGLL